MKTEGVISLPATPKKTIHFQRLKKSNVFLFLSFYYYEGFVVLVQ